MKKYIIYTKIYQQYNKIMKKYKIYKFQIKNCSNKIKKLISSNKKMNKRFKN